MGRYYRQFIFLFLSLNSGLLLRRVSGSTESKEAFFQRCTHLIIDEVHERERNNDILLVIIKDAQRSYPHLKVILMSATIDAQRFSQYFDNCPVIDVPGRTYDVEVSYLPAILRLTEYKIESIEHIEQGNEGNC